jgi:hypothetical protein
MNTEVENSLLFLLKKIPKQGRCATLEEIANINQQCNGILPDWYGKLLTKYPICGLEIGWQQSEPDEDDNGVSWMEWSNPTMMRGETFESYPGIAIYKHGFLNVGTCSHGSGNPYFIRVYGSKSN